MPPSAGRRVSVSMTTPRVVLIMDSPSAPAATTDSAISTMSVTSGDSFARTGTVEFVLRRTALITPAAADGSQAKTSPLLSTLGQEMLTSRAGDSGSWRSRLAAPPNSSAVLPAIETTPAHPPTQPFQVVGDEGFDARPLQSNGVEHPGGFLPSGVARPDLGSRHDALGHDAADGGHVEVRVQFTAGRGAATGREYRGRECAPASDVAMSTL